MTTSETEICELLRSAGIANADQEAAWIAEDARDALEARSWARRRAAGEPLQYVLGAVAFRHLHLKIGPGAFIPRPETEVVVGKAIDLLPDDGTVIDLCTGSGAIALAIAHERPDAQVHATEVSPEALKWANTNRGELPVTFHRGDLFSPLPTELRGSVDVVVSNPPYISYDEVDVLPPDVIDHEPHVALLASDRGLEVIERIVAESGRWLRSDGWLVLEIGAGQREPVMALFESSGFEDVVVEQDLAGRDRIAAGRHP